MKLQPGDYVSTEGMTEEEYHAVCRAFIEAGCPSHEPINWKAAEGFPFFGWGLDKTWSGLYHGGDLFFANKLTKDQILGAQKMTKVTVFGQEEAKKEEKKIEFMHLLRLDGESDICVYPQEYGNIVLLGEQEGYDLIMAWDDDASPNRAIFLGHWNDGVV